MGERADRDLLSSSQERREILESVCRLLEAQYVFPEIALSAIDEVRMRWDRGDYVGLHEDADFAETVTSDLQRVAGDAHLRLVFDPVRAAKLQDAPKRGAARDVRELARLRNHGFARLEHLKANVGVVDIRHFFAPEISGETAAAAMRFLADADAILVDLRSNTGGNPSMVQFLCSYFFDGETPIHLNSITSRPQCKTTEYWVLPDVPGRRMPDTALYVLTSGNTFSGGEEFAYNMAALGRGTIIGESTAGAANPASIEVISDAFYVTIPHASPMNPVTGKNWEGSGVMPHVEVRADLALETAHLMAVDQLIESESDDLAKTKRKWLREEIASGYCPRTLPMSALERLVGRFGETEVVLEETGLVYQRRFFRYRMIPLSATLFWLDGPAAGFEARVQFMDNGEGTVTQLVGLYPDGRTITQSRT